MASMVARLRQLALGGRVVAAICCGGPTVELLGVVDGCHGTRAVRACRRDWGRDALISTILNEGGSTGKIATPGGVALRWGAILGRV